MRAFCLLIALAVSSCSLAAETEMAQRRHHLRMKNRRVNRYLTTDEYRLMRAPKIVNGMKKTRIGSRVVDRDGITVQVGDDGKIGVNVDVTVNVNVGTDGGDGNSDETGEPECIEWETSYILASSKSSKSAGKSGKGSKGGKSSKSAGKSGKSTEVIPIRKCVAYATKNPSKSPTMEPVPIVTPNPTEVVSVIGMLIIHVIVLLILSVLLLFFIKVANACPSRPNIKSSSASSSYAYPNYDEYHS